MKEKGDGRETMCLSMVKEQILERGVSDPRVLEALKKIHRDLFVPEAYQSSAYEDSPLSIGWGQTISQPYIVAFMTEALQLKGNEKVLEIGTGSGYQTAVLAEIVREVFTIEIIEPLYLRARDILDSLGYQNIRYRCGDGRNGWPEEAPFDAIIVTAAPKRIPGKLKNQMAVDGRMVIPVGDFNQNLVRLTFSGRGYKSHLLLPVRFVPLVSGDHEKEES